MQTRLKSLLRSWLPVLIWLAIIAVESTDLMSSSSTESILYRLFSFFLGPINQRTFDFYHALLRKVGHFTGYAVLSLLIFRALILSHFRFLGSAARRMACVAVALTFIVASLDEWHQTLLPSRTGTIRDVLLDTSGALVAAVLLSVYLHWRTKFTAVRSEIAPDQLRCKVER